GPRGGDQLTGDGKARSRLGGVYLVASPKRPVSRMLEIVGASLEGGASIVQLRDKKVFTPEEKIEAARGLRQLCNRYHVLFIMNAADPRAATEAIRRAFSDGRLPAESRARPHRKRAREESSREHFHQQTVK